MELDSIKKSRQDSTMRSNSFETQEVREIGQKEVGESRRNNGRYLSDGRMKCKVQDKLKM